MNNGKGHKVPQSNNGVVGAKVGHAHLKVADLDRAIAFYRDVMGMRLMLNYGTHTAFLSFDDYHHHLGLNSWESQGGSPPPPEHTGLFHVAFLFPDRAAGAGHRPSSKTGHVLTAAADHGVGEAVYLNDPERACIFQTNSTLF